MTKSIKKNMPMAEKLFPAMQQAGLDIINGTATSVSVAQHIEEILALGYNGEIHERFSDFVIQNTDFLDPSWGEIKKSASTWTIVRARTRLVRPVGEILVDWIVLEAARRLTAGERIWIRKRGDYTRDEFLAKLPFIPPAFNLPARPDTPVAHTFWGLGYRIGDLKRLADDEIYDDIFDKILLWKTYYKEPFHDYRYGDIRSIEDYHQQRKLEALEVLSAPKIDPELQMKKEKREAKRNADRVWIDNTNRDIKNKDKRTKDIMRMKNMGLVERLEEIANSNYFIDYYDCPPWHHRKEWGEEFAKHCTVEKISEQSKKLLIRKLDGRNYHGWEMVKSQLAQENFSDNE